MGYGEGRSGGGEFRKREMFDAVCSECGQNCQVPFKPSKDSDGNPRPVYCRECYQKRKSRF